MEMKALIKRIDSVVPVTGINFLNKEVEVVVPGKYDNTRSYAFDEIDLSVSGKASDGSHTFDELYYHRMMLFSVICNQNKSISWKSWLHDDGEMYDGYFIVGIETKKGSYTYHYQKEYWDMFKVKELEHAPVWDGHKPDDITRLTSLFDD